MFKGIAASPGIAMGTAFVLESKTATISQTPITTENIATEIKAFDDALVKAHLQLENIKKKTQQELGADKAAIFDAHLMILADDVFLDAIRDKISSQLVSAEYAVSQVVEQYVQMFAEMEDEYLKERAADIKDIGQRIINNILGLENQSLSALDREAVIIAKDLTPSDTAQLDKKLVKGFATDLGGRTSHTAIMARSLEIPAVVGLGDLSDQVKDQDTIIIDGNEGIVILNPDEATIEEYRRKGEEYSRFLQELAQLKDLPCETQCCGRRVEIAANIGTPNDVEGALANGAEGIGLYRTEFLYMDRDSLPSEEEQFAAYKEVVETMAPKPVIIRTLDIGGDKKLPYLEMPEELNPFLGWRAIRLCLDRSDIFKTQLRAILRASNFGKVRIMYPMISNAEEIRQANRYLAEAKEELAKEGQPFNPNVEVGIMVEIPAAAVTADLLAQEVDFFSIGTNDLIQYTIAVDRMNERISHLYDPLHPAILRLIKQVIDASHRAGKWTGMCGEMAGDVEAAPILLGMGLDEFSMSASSIPRIKKVIRSLSYQEACEIAQEVLTLQSANEIRARLQKIKYN
ncbi:MAG: phosphoenolpyruvate--protein phosphotransferase [Peptococcia bacterium]